MRLSLEWRPRTRGELLAGLADALEALVRINEREIVSWRLPPLYQSGVRYEPEDGTERWLGASIVYTRGAADCEDLVAWLVAERRLAGDVHAKGIAFVVGFDQLGRMLLHCVAVTSRGIEDPSVVLGMPSYQRQAARKPIVEAFAWSRSHS